MSNKGAPFNYYVQGVASDLAMQSLLKLTAKDLGSMVHDSVTVFIPVLRPSFVRWPQEVAFVPDRRFREIVSEGLKFMGDGDFDVIAKWSDE